MDDKLNLSDEDLAGLDNYLSNQSSLELSDDDLRGLDMVTKGPSIGESTLRGSAQGLTFGFSDEAKGLGSSAVQSLLESLNVRPDDQMSFEEKYIKERDAERTANKLAEETNPWAYNIGDIGTSVATGVLTGGAGLLGKGALGVAKGGAKTLLKEGIESGATKGLMALGAAEGAAHGLGRSEADLTKGEIEEAAIDTATGAAIGGIAPMAIKGAGKALDYSARKIPLVRNVYSHYADVGLEGMKRPGRSYEEAGQDVVKELGESAKSIKAKGLEQESKYFDDLFKAQGKTNKELYEATGNFKDTLKKSLDLTGKEIENQDILIQQALKNTPGWLTKVNDELAFGRFNLENLKEPIEAASKKITRGKALEDIYNRMRSNDYLEISNQMRELNALIEAADPYERQILAPIKKEIQRKIDSSMSILEGDAANLYKKRMDLNKDYSLLSDIKEGLGASQYDRTGTLQTKMSVAANPKAGGDTLDYKNLLQKAYQSGDQDLIKATEDALKKAESFNKFNIQNPELGTMFTDLVPKNIQKVDDYFTPSNQLDLEDIALTWKGGSKGYDPTKQLSSGQFYHDEYPLDKLLPYKEYDRPVEQSLLNSLKQTGFKEPIVVQVAKDGSLKVAEGNHRLVAAQTLGIKDIPVKFDFVKESVGSPVSKMVQSPSGQNEKLYQQFKESLGAPKEFSSPQKLATALEETGGLQQGISGEIKDQNLIQWLKDTYGDSADEVIADLQQRAKSFRTLEDARDARQNPWRDVSSMIRGLKSIGDEAMFIGGKSLKALPDPIKNQTNIFRTLTQPVSYKDTVQQFKDSQKQGDTEQ